MSLKKNNLWQKSFFYNVIESHRLIQSYILLGSDHQKKIWLASSIAKGLLCPCSGAEYCDSCPTCLKVNSHNHPDVLWVRPTGAQRMIKIDQIRELQAALAFKSFEGGKKVAFILHADRMKAEAANALLKTIEEPPESTYVFLLADNSESLLPTITSRCQQITLPLSSNEDILQFLLDELTISPEKAKFITMMSQGNFSHVYRYLNDARIEWRDYIISSLAELFHGKIGPAVLSSNVESGIQEIIAQKEPDENSALKSAGFTTQQAHLLTDADKKAIDKSIHNKEVCDFFETMALFCRDVIIYKSTGESNLLVNADKIEMIASVARIYEEGVLSDFLNEIHQAYSAFLGNTKLVFVLEILFDSLKVNAPCNRS